MRAFTIVGVLLVTAAALLWVQSGLRIAALVNNRGFFSLEFWTSEFWLAYPDTASWQLGQNAYWFIRIIGGGFLALVGIKIIRSTG